MKIKHAQKIVKDFADKNGWSNEPSVDKIDHLHEELVEISKHLRYKDIDMRKKILKDKSKEFEDGIGDLLFGTMRLANQLGVDAEQAFEKASRKIIRKYEGKEEAKHD